MSDLFDFSGLKKNPPAGMNVVSATLGCLILSRRREHEPTRYFTVTNREGKFQLWHKTDGHMKRHADKATRSEGDLLLEKPEPWPLLTAIGYRYAHATHFRKWIGEYRPDASA